MKRLLLLGAGILLALSLTGSGALADAPGTCSGTLQHPGVLVGTTGSVVVTGTCFATAALTVNGSVTVADGAVFAGFAPVHITGNVKVGQGAQLFLGWNAAPGELGPDVVDGNIVATQPLSLYLGNITVHGNVVSNGGGTADRFFNFPIKDNQIDGNLTIHGWTGGWWGVIANTIGGNVDVSNNSSVVVPAAESTCEGTFPAGCTAVAGTDQDANEIQSRFGNPQHIAGNLVCHDNTPVAQVNPGDGGAANVVGGQKIGECAGL